MWLEYKLEYVYWVTSTRRVVGKFAVIAKYFWVLVTSYDIQSVYKRHDAGEQRNVHKYPNPLTCINFSRPELEERIP